MKLQGSTAIVTGSAHRVGRGIALSLAEKGCNIIVHYGKSEEKAKETISLLNELGVDSTAYSADLRQPEAIKDFVREVSENYNYQILVNSAASFVKKSFLQTTMEDWNTAMRINVDAPFLLIQQTAEKLQEHNDSLIVNISDLSALYPWQNFTAHGVSKAALLHLTKYAARELAPKIRVNAILPGPILPPPEMPESDPRWQEMINNIPLKKSGQPNQIGQTVVYFAENEYVTGAIVNVDGGEGLIGPKNH